MFRYVFLKLCSCCLNTCGGGMGKKDWNVFKSKE